LECHEPAEDHEFFGRDRNQVTEVTVRLDPANRLGGRSMEVVWRVKRLLRHQ